MTHEPDHHASLGEMYSDYFLDYASYVILERAVPHLADGLKPVQRRILHAMDEIDDGRYNKVAGIVGNTMNYHPHGDASIAAAMVATERATAKAAARMRLALKFSVMVLVPSVCFVLRDLPAG